MQRTFTTIGKDYNRESVRSRLVNVINSIEWQSLPCELGMMPGEGIKQTIKQFRIPKVSHVAVSSDLAPYGLYGIRGYYKNGMAELFVVDAGSEIVPVVSDFYPKEV